MKKVKIQKQPIEQKNTFAKNVESKIKKKFQGLSKNGNHKSTKIKHPKSGKGL